MQGKWKNPIYILITFAILFSISSYAAKKDLITKHILAKKTPMQVLANLQAGNKRYVNGDTRNYDHRQTEENPIDLHLLSSQ